MNRSLSLIALALAAIPAHAQFGNVFNKAKERLDRAKQQAKPATDRAQRAVDTYQPWSAEEEQQIGEAAAAKMIAIFGLVEDPQAVRYVNLVGNAVAQFAARQIPYRFAILNTEIVAAFALPGGYVFITGGALANMQNEAQLAGALGHEIVHSAERHLEKEIRSKNTTNWAVEEGRAKAGNNLAFVQQRADALVKDLFSTKLSRDKEDAADEQGTQLAARAGYAANGLLQFLQTLEVTNKQNPRAFGQLLSTHPSFEDRIQHLTPLAAQGGKTLEARFMAVMSGQAQ